MADRSMDRAVQRQFAGATTLATALSQYVFAVFLVAPSAWAVPAVMSIGSAVAGEGAAASARVEDAEEEGESPVAEVEDSILVTAKPVDAGTNITVFDDDAFRDLRGSNINRLANQLPSVEIYGAGLFLQSFTVRGIGLSEIQGNLDTPVGVRFDDVHVSKPWMIPHPAFDIARVEVLKGPQGTLFGRNTAGGAVNYYTRPPTRDTEVELIAEADGHNRYSVESVVNAPLTRRLAGRLSVHSGFGSGGPWHNRFTGDDVGRWDRLLYRGQLAWRGEATAVRLLLHGGRDAGDMPPTKGPGIFDFGAQSFCDAVLAGRVTDAPASCPKYGGLAPDPAGEFEPDDPYTIDQNYWPRRDDRHFGGFLRVDHDFAAVRLTSITSHESYERDQREDSAGGRFVDTNTDWYTDIDQLTQEVRLSAEPHPRWRYVAGLLFGRDDLTEVDSSDLGGNPLGLVPPFAPRVAAAFTQDVTSASAFWHNVFKLTDQLDASVGLRWTEETIELDAATFLGANDPKGRADVVTPVIPVDALRDRRVDSVASWKLGLDWRASTRTLAYANLSTGFRSAGYSVPFAGLIVTFAPEDVRALEVGVRSRLGETAHLGAAAYAYERDDLHLTVDDPVSPFGPITRNVEGARSWGVETTARWAPTSRWELGAGVGYLDAEFKKTERTITTYSGLIPVAGKRPVNAPELTANGLVRYRRPLASGAALTVLTDFRHTGERFFEATNQPFDRADAYTVVNARAALTAADERWELALWGENVLGEEYLVFGNNISFFKIDIFGMPPTWGATFRYRIRGRAKPS